MAKVLRTDVHLTNPTSGLPTVLKAGTKESDLDDWAKGKAQLRDGKDSDVALLGDHVWRDDSEDEVDLVVAGPSQVGRSEHLDTLGIELVDENPLTFGANQNSDPVVRRQVGPDIDVSEVDPAEIQPQPGGTGPQVGDSPAPKRQSRASRAPAEGAEARQ